MSLICSANALQSLPRVLVCTRVALLQTRTRDGPSKNAWQLLDQRDFGNLSHRHSMPSSEKYLLSDSYREYIAFLTKDMPSDIVLHGRQE